MKKAFQIAALLLSLIFITISCEKEAPNYELKIEIKPLNSGTATGAGIYKAGEEINLVATPAEGYIFVNWTQGTTVLGTNKEFKYITTAEAVTLTANFEQKIIITLGAQSNTTQGAFYSVGHNVVYNQATAFDNQEKINLMCFYEHIEPDFINDISIASPGSNIKGIYEGTTSPVYWTTKNLSTFTPPAKTLTIENFDKLVQNDPEIQTYYNETIVSGNRKVKLLKSNDIYAFKTHDGKYGLFKVISTVQGATGSVTIELKVKK
jgi:uncharacterized repeat protein (TIGR02543 family)